MRWLLLTVLTGVASVALAIALAASASTHATRLTGTTGPGQKITLTKGGKAFDYLKPGTYAITVRDRSSRHGFTLSGRTDTGRIVRSITISAVRFIGTRTVTVTLQPGVYNYYCPAHAKPWLGGMGGSFRVD